MVTIVPAAPSALLDLPTAAQTVIDPRTGIVRQLQQTKLPDDFPPSLVQFTTTVSDTTRFSRWAADTAGAGTAFSDWSGAAAAALGEAIERYCSNLIPADLRAASYAQLVAAGEEAVDPLELALYSDAQHATPGFPFVRFDRDLVVRWAPARRIATGRPAWVPASLVWITYFEGTVFAGEPPTNALVHAGIAAGSDQDDAEWRGLSELVERDAMTLAWTSRVPLHRIEVPEPLRPLVERSCANFRIRFLWFPSDFGVPVVGALLEDHARGYRCLGTACRANVVDALTKALAEALQMQLIVRQLDDPDSVFMRVAASSTSPLKRWRPARDYRRAYRQDWRDLIHHACHLQVHLDPELTPDFERELGDLLPISVDEVHEHVVPLTAADPPGRRDELVDRLERRGHPVYAVDVTTPDVRSTSIRVSRVTAPGLYSYAAAAFPCLGGRRLAEALHRAGEAAPRVFPFPH